MKKRDRKIKQGNVILFPDLDKRLLEKGLESLQEKKFRQAIDYFTEAKTLDSENYEINIGLVVAYYEAGYLQEAKKLANEMLKEGIGDYIQTVDLYLMILVQLHQYDEIVTTIEVLLDEQEIPPDKEEHFTRMLHFSRRMVEGKEDIPAEYSPEPVRMKTLNLNECTDPKEQMMLISQLTNQNIRPYLPEIIDYLKSQKGHPFLKTLLLNVLKEQEVDSEIVLEKFGWKKTLKPSNLFEIHEQPQLNEILKELSDHLENMDPVLYENVNGLIERHLFLVYPFELHPQNPLVWAAAYHAIAYEYHGMDIDLDEVCEIYQVEAKDVLDAHSLIREIEEISYPII